MSEIRKKAVLAVVELLKQGNTRAEDRVFVNPILQSFLEKGPVLTVYLETETADIDTGGDETPRIYKRAPSLAVEILDSKTEPDELFQSNEDFLQEVQDALFCETDLRGAVDSFVYTRTEWGFTTRGRELVGAARMLFELSFRDSATQENKPNADVAPFKTAGIELDSNADGTPEITGEANPPQ